MTLSNLASKTGRRIPRWVSNSVTLAALTALALTVSLLWNLQSINCDIRGIEEAQLMASGADHGDPVFRRALRQHDSRVRSMYLLHGALFLIGMIAVGLGAVRHQAVERRRHAAEGQLEFSHSLIKAALESTADGILVVSSEGQVKMRNSRFLEMWNIPADIAESENDDRALEYVVSQLADPEQFLSKVRELYSNPEATSFDLIEFKDGRVFERYSQPQRIGRTIHGRVWSFRDVTERRQTEKELLKSLDAAHAANRAKSTFLANISHEIRTPLNGVLGMTELALQTNLDAQQRDYLQTACASAESLLLLVDQLLDLTKMESGRLSLEAADFNLRIMVGQVMQTVASQAAAKHVALDCEIDEKMPERLVGDPLRLRQVLTNLLSNAVKFTHHGSVRVSLTAQESGKQTMLRVDVTDTGIGIPADRQEAIFRAFVQCDDSTSRNYGGTGLGLAISKQLVELMGGHLWVMSEPGKGSTFSFTAAIRLGEAEEGKTIGGDIACEGDRAA